MTRGMWFLGVCAVGLLAMPVAAQSKNGQSGSGSSSSLFGSSGSSGSNSSSFGSTSGSGGNSNLNSALNSALGGQGGGFGGGNGAGGGLTGLGNLSGITQQNSGFIGRNTGNNNQFIGRTAQGQANGNGQNSGQNRNRGGNGNRSLDQSILNGGSNQAGTSSVPTIRPRLKAAFDFPAADLAKVTTRSQVLFDRLTTRLPQMDQVQVSHADNGDIVLTGSVDSERSAKLAESVIRLEPGVRKVQNDLKYPPPQPE
ncbi:BON domain-containing protein [bacterium]|nr:BON domain-containing protein [bacterium]